MSNNPTLLISKSYNIFKLKHTWDRIYRNNPIILPLQSFNYYKHLFLSFYSNHIRSRWRIVFHYLSDGQNECIVPLVIHKRKKMIKGLSSFGRLDYEDIVSSTNDRSFTNNCLKRVLAYYDGYYIQLININENSILHCLLHDNLMFHENCVIIDLPSKVEDYILSLSKHQRQNIRSAYNKINKEKFDIELKSFHVGNIISRSQWRQCQQMYETRHGVKGNRFKIWLARQTNPYTHILHSGNNWLIFVLFHNSTPISYMAGLINNNKDCLFIPRLCINNSYRKYSPGILLLTESIPHLISHGIRHLDLMSGDESYKLAMGGRTHKNYKIETKVTSLFEKCTLR